MKKIILLITVLLSINSFGQKGRFKSKVEKEVKEEVKRVKDPNFFFYDIEGLSPKYLVKNIDSLNVEKLYSKTIDWIKETYKNPDEVIKAKFENEKVRFSGFSSSYLKLNSLGIIYSYDVKYTIEISIKEGKYKFEPTKLEYYIPVSKYSSGGWETIDLDNGIAYYNKKKKLRNMYKQFPKDVDLLFNSLESSLNTYLLKINNTVKDTDNDW